MKDKTLQNYRDKITQTWGKDSSHGKLLEAAILMLRQDWDAHKATGGDLVSFNPIWSLNKLWETRNFETSKEYFHCALWFCSPTLQAFELRLIFRDDGLEKEFSGQDGARFLEGEPYIHPKTGESLSGNTLKERLYPYVRPTAEFLAAMMADSV